MSQVNEFLFINLCLLCYRDADLAQKIGAATALEVRASGVQYTFAPCVAVSYQSYSVA